MTEGEESRYSVPNLERALTIMEFISLHPDQANMADLSRNLGFPKNSVFRIISTLEDRGYVIRQGDSRNYRLSRKLLALGYQSLTEAGLTEQAHDSLRQLRDLTRETALLGILLEQEGVVLDQMLSPEAVKVAVTPGTRFALHTSAPGKAILAFLPPTQTHQLVEGMTFSRQTSRTITGAQAFLQELEQVRAAGYALDRGEDVSGVICIGAPVFDYRQQPVAAMWITGPEYRLAPKKWAELGLAIKKHADTVSTLLGSPSSAPTRVPL